MIAFQKFQSDPVQGYGYTVIDRRHFRMP